MARKKWTAEEKARIVMEVLTTSAPLSEICRRYNVQPTTMMMMMVHKWKQEFIEGGSRALAGKDASDREKKLEEQVRKLKEIVADLTLANEIFKSGSREMKEMVFLQLISNHSKREASR